MVCLTCVYASIRCLYVCMRVWDIYIWCICACICVWCVYVVCVYVVCVYMMSVCEFMVSVDVCGVWIYVFMWVWGMYMWVCGVCMCMYVYGVYICVSVRYVWFVCGESVYSVCIWISRKFFLRKFWKLLPVPWTWNRQTHSGKKMQRHTFKTALAVSTQESSLSQLGSTIAVP